MSRWQTLSSITESVICDIKLKLSLVFHLQQVYLFPDLSFSEFTTITATEVSILSSNNNKPHIFQRFQFVSQNLEESNHLLMNSKTSKSILWVAKEYGICLDYDRKNIIPKLKYNPRTNKLVAFYGPVFSTKLPHFPLQNLKCQFKNLISCHR